MDTFIDSSWYFERYCSPAESAVPFAKEDVGYWMNVRPVHRRDRARDPPSPLLTLLHEVPQRHRLIQVDEPFERLLTQGMVTKESYACEEHGYSSRGRRRRKTAAASAGSP